MTDVAVRRAQLPTVRPPGTGLGTCYSRIIGDGEMAELIRGFDWARSRLGPVETWPDILVTTVNLLLASRHPMFLWWGTDLVQFYNDSYRPSISAEKHPIALGQCGIECWPEIWEIIGAQIETVMNGGSTFHVNQLVPITRNGRVEEVFWTYSYSPVRGNDGNVQGALVVCSETTEQVLSERRLRTLLAVDLDSPAQHRPGAQPLLTFAQTIVERLSRDPADCPFVALFQLSQGEILHSESAASESGLSDPSHWPLAELVASQTSLLIGDLRRRLGVLICEPWPEAVSRAYLVPLGVPGSSIHGVLVLGISPRLPFDESYQTFFQLVGARISNLLQTEILQRERSERAREIEHQAAALAEKAALLDLTQDAIVVRDMHDEILFWNRGAESMYGWPSQEAMGRNTFELLKTELFGTAEEMKAELLSQDRWQGEAIHKKRDGTAVIVAGRSALQRDANGNPARILTIDNEITARKQVEAKLLLLTERLSLATAVAKVGVWEWELATNGVIWDATMFDIYGIPTVVPMPAFDNLIWPHLDTYIWPHP